MGQRQTRAQLPRVCPQDLGKSSSRLHAPQRDVQAGGPPWVGQPRAVRESGLGCPSLSPREPHRSETRPQNGLGLGSQLQTPNEPHQGPVRDLSEALYLGSEWLKGGVREGLRIGTLTPKTARVFCNWLKRASLTLFEAATANKVPCLHLWVLTAHSHLRWMQESPCQWTVHTQRGRASADAKSYGAGQRGQVALSLCCLLNRYCNAKYHWKKTGQGRGDVCEPQLEEAWSSSPLQPHHSSLPSSPLAAFESFPCAMLLSAPRL